MINISKNFNKFKELKRDQKIEISRKIIEKFKMKDLPGEGGFFIETFRSDELLSNSKNLSTSILYMITSESFSSLHKLPSWEIYHFYLGDPVLMLNLCPEGRSEVISLGSDIFDGEKIQFAVPANTWQGSYLKDGGVFALMGTTVSPGFRFEDYEKATPLREELIKEYPEVSDMIEKLT
ncbi:MAG: cupin domain-containing protein [Actinobacteria bacterium]|nr:cupin domain-containing protein [Actinomycetota bacterium]